MSVSINTVKKGVELLAAKDQKTIYLNAAKYNVYAPMALDKVINDQRRKYEADSMSSDAFSELKTSKMVSVNSSGVMTKPTDYLYFDTAMVSSYYNNKNGLEYYSKNVVDLVRDSEISSRLSSIVNKPTKSSPIISTTSNGFKVYPKDTGIIELFYIKKPSIPFWNYTTSSNEQVYAASGGELVNPNDSGSTSTDFQLPAQFTDDLIWTICEYLGVTVRQADLIQASQALNTKA